MAPKPYKAQEGAVAVGEISQEKACQILEEGVANGQELTPAQRRFFGARCSGQAPRRAEDGALVIPRDYGTSLMDVAHDLPAVT